jgi:hypothetical protein
MGSRDATDDDEWVERFLEGGGFSRMAGSMKPPMLRLCRALCYAVAAIILTWLQVAVPVGAFAMGFVVLVLAIPKRSLLLAELILGALALCLFLPHVVGFLRAA